MNSKKITCSLVFNFLIVVLTAKGFMRDIFENFKDSLLDKNEPSIFLQFRFYTILTNLILAIVAIIFIVYDFLLIRKINKIPNWLIVLKMCATTGTTITMFVVCFILFPGALAGFSKVGLGFAFSGTSKYYHIFTPILGILTFILFETNRDIKLVNCCFGMIFTELYSIFYIVESLTHFLPSSGPLSHDWYSFVSLVGYDLIFPMMIVFAGFAFLITWLLWLGNRKIHILEKTATK